MAQITVTYPKAKSYTLNVNDEEQYVYDRHLVVEGYRSANTYGRRLVVAHRKRAKKERLVVTVPAVPMLVGCVNRECEWCSNESCTLRHSEQR